MKNYYLLLSLLVLFIGCESKGNSSDENSTANANSQDAVPVSVEQVQPSSFNHYISIQGAVESDKTIMISPKASGTVEEVLVEAGDRVRKGQVLARLDGEITKSQINEVKTQLELARTMYERRKNLRDKDIGSEIQFLQAKNNVASLESQLATLREQYENYQIKTSIGGRLSRVTIKEGENVGPSVPVFQVANSSALKVTAEVSESYLSTVDETDSVTISFPSVNEQLTKRIDVVSEVIDPANRTFSIEVFIDNDGGKIRPNMLAKLKINDYTRHDVLTTSLNNINKSNGDGFLYVVEETDGGLRAQKQTVQTGASYGEGVIITGGLSVGDRIITVGGNSVSDSDPITIVEN